MRSLSTIAFILFSTLRALAQEDEGRTATADPIAKKDIQKLAQKKSIKDAFAVIDQLEPITHQELIMLNEIPAPPFKEEVRARKFKSMLEEAGADKVWIDSVGNVLALRKGTKPTKTIALDAHLDTVFPEGTDVKVKMKGDTLYAPGIGDDTRGLMVILTVLRAMEKVNMETTEDVLFIGTVGEEGLGDLRGVKYLFKKNSPRIDSWISIDGGEIGRVNNGALGSIRYRVTFKGPGGHSWGAFGLANPHHALGKAIDYFAEAASKFTATGTKTSFNVGRIGGGTSVNSIPFESWMEVDMRSEDPDRLKQIDEIFKLNVNRALIEYNQSIKSGPALTADIKQVGYRPPGVESEKLPLVQRSMAAADYFKVPLMLTTGSTNSNIPISLGIPAVTLGRGGKGGNAHALNEWWLNDKGADAIKFTLLVVASEAGVSK